MMRAAGFAELSSEAFASLGAQDIAYVRRVTDKDRVLFEVHGADGTPFAVFDSRDVAIAAVRQNGLEPLSVH